MKLSYILLFEDDLPKIKEKKEFLEMLSEHVEVLFCSSNLLSGTKESRQMHLSKLLDSNGISLDDCLLIANKKTYLLWGKELGLAALPVELPSSFETYEGFKIILSDYEDAEWDFFEKAYQREHYLPWTVIKTKRLLIREETEEDVPWMYELHAQESVKKFIEPLNQNIEDEIEYIKKYRMFIYTMFGYGIWHLESLENGAPIGRAGLSPKEYEDGVRGVELGYIIDERFGRQGYCMEACKAIIEYARDTLELNSIYCLIRWDNDLSKKIALKLGFTLDRKITDRGRNMERYIMNLND